MARDQLYEKEWIEFYDNMTPEAHYRRSFKILLHTIRKHCPEAQDVLELACGTGRYTKYLVKQGFHVTASDISYAAIKVARSRVHHAEFHVEDRSAIHGTHHFDIVACLFEAFRYHKSYSACRNTLKNINLALSPGGIFLCDFGIFPSAKRPDKPQIHHEVKISGSRLIIRDETIYTKGNFDVREDRFKVFQKRLFGRRILLKEGTLERAPLLRISEAKMKSMLSDAGFKTLQIIKQFQPSAPRSRLFVAKKK